MLDLLIGNAAPMPQAGAPMMQNILAALSQPGVVPMGMVNPSGKLAPAIRVGKRVFTGGERHSAILSRLPKEMQNAIEKWGVAKKRGGHVVVDGFTDASGRFFRSKQVGANPDYEHGLPVQEVDFNPAR